MASDIEEQKKLLLPILQRAEEIQQVEPKVAYYCRLYAVDQALKMTKRAKEIDQLLMATLMKLEKDKPLLKLDKENDSAVCEQFALDIFNRADRVDRAGKADVNTCKAYYAASVFMDICNQFGELPADIVEKQRYGLWRAAEIRKAIREGRPPIPPAADNPPPMSAAGGDPVEMLLGPAPSPIPGPTPGPTPSDSGTQPMPGFPSAPSSAYPSASFPDHPPAPSPYPSASFPDHPSGPSPYPPPSFPDTPQLPPQQAPSNPRFRPGDRVLLNESGCPPFQKGTVGKVEVGGGEPSYRVALPSHIVDARESDLALDVLPGATVVVLNGPTAPQCNAVVLAVHTAMWPPRYLVQDDSGRPFDATAAQVMPAPLSSQGSGGGAGYPTMPPMSSAPSAPPPEPPTSSPYHTPPANLPPPPASTAPPPPSSYPSHHHQPPPLTPNPYGAAPPPSHPPPPPTGGTHGFPQFTPKEASLQEITEAQKLLKYATSSLSFEDMPSAVKYLSDALKLIAHPR